MSKIDTLALGEPLLPGSSNHRQILKLLSGVPPLAMVTLGIIR